MRRMAAAAARSHGPRTDRGDSGQPSRRRGPDGCYPPGAAARARAGRQGHRRGRRRPCDGRERRRPTRCRTGATRADARRGVGMHAGGGGADRRDPAGPRHGCNPRRDARCSPRRWSSWAPVRRASSFARWRPRPCWASRCCGSCSRSASRGGVEGCRDGGIAWLPRARRSGTRSPGPPVAVAAVLVVVTLAWRLVLAVRLPMVDYDGWSYHLVFADVWLQHDQIVGVLQRPWTAGYPANTELLTTWLMAFTRTDALAGLTSVLPIPLAMLAVTGLARTLGAGRRFAALAGLVFGMTPALVALAGTSTSTPPRSRRSPRPGTSGCGSSAASATPRRPRSWASRRASRSGRRGPTSSSSPPCSSWPACSCCATCSSRIVRRARVGRGVRPRRRRRAPRLAGGAGRRPRRLVVPEEPPRVRQPPVPVRDWPAARAHDAHELRVRAARAGGQVVPGPARVLVGRGLGARAVPVQRAPGRARPGVAAAARGGARGRDRARAPTAVLGPRARRAARARVAPRDADAVVRAADAVRAGDRDPARRGGAGRPRRAAAPGRDGRRARHRGGGDDLARVRERAREHQPPPGGRVDTHHPGLPRARPGGRGTSRERRPACRLRGLRHHPDRRARGPRRVQPAPRRRRARAGPCADRPVATGQHARGAGRPRCRRARRPGS